MVENQPFWVCVGEKYFNWGAGPQAGAKNVSTGVLVAPLVFRVPEGPAAVCAGGRRPAREPSALRASLGASARCPARPRRPRGGLQSGGVSVCCLARPRHRPPAPQPDTLVPSGPSGAIRTGAT